MPYFDFECPACKRVFRDVMVPPTGKTVSCDGEDGVKHPWQLCARMPAAPNFKVEGYNAKNGYSKR